MNEEAQIRAIARAIGFPAIHNVTGRGWVYGVKDGFRASEFKVPDWLHDLNAMHAAEKHLGDVDEWLLYEGYLDEGGTKFAFHATAAQRAEAFLRALDLWKEDSPMSAITESFKESE